VNSWRGIKDACNYVVTELNKICVASALAQYCLTFIGTEQVRLAHLQCDPYFGNARFKLPVDSKLNYPDDFLSTLKRLPTKTNFEIILRSSLNTAFISCVTIYRVISSVDKVSLSKARVKGHGTGP
jgi:hypothetical protein